MSNDPWGSTPSTAPDPQQSAGDSAASGSGSTASASQPNPAAYGQQPTSPAYPQASYPYPGQSYPQQPAYPQAAYPQSAYPQQPWTGQATPQPTTQQAWDAQASPASWGAQTPQPGAAQYGSAHAYGSSTASYGADPMAKPTRSPVLGIIAFLAVIVLGVVLCILSYSAGESMAPVLAQGGVFNGSGSYSSGYEAGQSMTPAEQDQVMGAFTPTVPIGIIGLVAWVVSIVATATRRGRGWGVAGLIIGIFMPLAGFLAIVAGVMASGYAG